MVSVLPSATEIVCALGGRESLVGRSEECDFPPSVRELPVVMRARTHDGERSSTEIDARVRAALASGESLYELDVPLIARLRPDLLLTQDLCRVCSVTEAEVGTALRAAGVASRILSLSPTRLDEVWSSVESVGAAIGEGERGRALAAHLRTRTPPGRPGPTAPRVAVLEWIEPFVESGLWTPDLIASAGGVPWSARPGGPAPRPTWSDLDASRPDLVIVSPCSFPVERTRAELEHSPNGRRLREWKVPFGVWVADEAYFSRPGPRLAEGRQLIADLLARRPPSVPGAQPWTSGLVPEAA